jgi:radical SAM enzyme (TIGR01210 family)
MTTDYPARVSERNAWILSRRGQRNSLDPFRPYASLYEEETGEEGFPISTATLFLTNKECPFRCLMCDLWQNTLTETVPSGAIPHQIRHALAELPHAKQIKLYNSGSFFDPKAIPVDDYPAIAQEIMGFERVIVESHPAFITPHLFKFTSLLSAKLEVAMGLETANPQILEKLNKQITRDSFREKSAFLASHGIALRVFILLRPPYQTEEEGLLWAKRSLDFAFECGATVCCVIPVRDGNGAVEALAKEGNYTPPSIASLVEAVHYGLSLGKGRVFADLWDIHRFARTPEDHAHIAALELLNRTQILAP